jgi:hypothetical protein
MISEKDIMIDESRVWTGDIRSTGIIMCRLE